MCDTIVALPDATLDGVVLLAKNADTEVNEAQQILRLPTRHYAAGALVRVTHRTIPQATLTHEVLLDRSFWAWGGEIGCNEHGVAIGNEAAFSNQTPDGDGVVVLDLLRLALERAATAREAVDVIGHHVEAFGQGGNVQMMGNCWWPIERKPGWSIARGGIGRPDRPVPRKPSRTATRSPMTGHYPR